MRSKAVQRFLVGCALLALAACSQKAETLKLAASQFETESRATIVLLEELRVSEIAPPAKSESAETADFIKNALESTRDATPDRIALWMNPDAGETVKASEEWAATLTRLNTQYRAFANTFASLEQASFTARDIVKKAEPVAVRLVGQIANFGKAVTDNPPEFLKQRTALSAQLKTLRAAQTNAADKRAKLSGWLDKWRALMQAETDLQRRIAEQSAKAASVGLAVVKQIRAYDQLSASDIADAMGIAFSAAGALTGRDVSALQNKANDVLGDIQSDPVWNSILQQSLEEVNQPKAKE